MARSHLFLLSSIKRRNRGKGGREGKRAGEALSIPSPTSSREKRVKKEEKKREREGKG